MFSAFWYSLHSPGGSGGGIEGGAGSEGGGGLGDGGVAGEGGGFGGEGRGVLERGLDLISLARSRRLAAPAACSGSLLDLSIG